MIDRLREQLQERLDQLLGEADRLRKALAALDPRPPSRPPASPLRARPPRRPSPSRPLHDEARTGPADSQPAARSPRRTAPGATKAAVLAALAGGEAMTAGEVADKAGLARATVSTTLSKLAKSGEVQKAERGYRRAPAPTGDTVRARRVASLAARRWHAGDSFTSQLYRAARISDNISAIARIQRMLAISRWEDRAFFGCLRTKNGCAA